jgi:hypothetical protein
VHPLLGSLFDHQFAKLWRVGERMTRYFTWGLVVSFFCPIAVSAQPAQILIIRHAEKPDEGSKLSLAGRERAAALAPYFLGNDELLQFGPPVAIYAQAQKHASSSLRPIETVEPLAAAIHIKINDSFERDDFAAMVEEILHNKTYDGHTVLICWEHKVIPQIAAKFGAATASDKWPGAVFDRTWVLTLKDGHGYAFEDLPQQLMFGDSRK